MSKQENETMNSWKIWWLAIRPKTLPAAASGVVMGSALAWMDHSFQILASFGGVMRGASVADWK